MIAVSKISDIRGTSFGSDSLKIKTIKIAVPTTITLTTGYFTIKAIHPKNFINLAGTALILALIATGTSLGTNDIIDRLGV